MSKFLNLIFSICLIVFFLNLRSTPASPAVYIVKQHQPQATIVTPDNASEPVRAAAQMLSQYIATSTGARLATTSESQAQGGVRIHVGPTQFALRANVLAGLGIDGFIIHPADANNVIILGTDDWGTEFGVDEFLERFVGVRWLMPGANGTVIPQNADIVVPGTSIKQQPATVMRRLGGLSGQAAEDWARRNRMHAWLQFSHNMWRLFPAARYGRTNPELLSRDGRGGAIRAPKSEAPNDPANRGWQPCFSAPNAVGEAVRNINQYFAEHPEERSFSLGVNDAGGFCAADLAGGRNALGLPDASNAYYRWANAVVAEVLKTYPDKWFGCLAYSEVVSPPNFKLNPRLVPLLTADRLKWADPQEKSRGQALAAAWQNSAPMLGWYDYLYGRPYVVPRVYFHQMAQNYRFAYEHGVRMHYAEAYPNWGEGPKYYLALKLQWDPYQDVDALLRDWYTAAVGPAAADDLAAYYKLWEDFWTGPAVQSAWFKTAGSGHGQYLNFKSPTYLDAVTPDMLARSRNLLQAVKAKAQTPAQSARADVLLRAFESTQVTAYSYISARNSGRPLTSETQALNAVTDAERVGRLESRRHQLSADDAADETFGPMAKKASPIDAISWTASSFWSLIPWLKSPRVLQQVQKLATSDDPEVARQAQFLLRVHNGQARAVTNNASFEEGDGDKATGWNYWLPDGDGLRRSTEFAHTGRSSLEADGVNRGGPTQYVPAAPGHYVGSCYVYVEAGQQSEGTLNLSISVKGLDKPDNTATLVQPVPGQWTLVTVEADVEAGADRILFVPTLQGFDHGERVFLDDCVLYRDGGR